MSLPLSQKHGLNPSLMVCCMCGKDTCVALCGRLPNDAEAPHKLLDPGGPCEACKAQIEEFTAQGTVLLVIGDGYDAARERAEDEARWRTHRPKPIITPWMWFEGLYVVKPGVASRIFNCETGPVNFIAHEAAKAVGLLDTPAVRTEGPNGKEISSEEDGQEGAPEESEQEDAAEEEGRQEEGRQEEGRQEEGRQEEGRQEEVDPADEREDA